MVIHQRKPIKKLRNFLKVLASETFSSVSAPIQYAAIAAYKNDQSKYLEKSRNILKAVGTYVYENLKSNKERYNLAASFQETVNKILKKKTEVAMNQFRNEITDKSLKYFVVAGGVAANETIRKGLKEVSLKMNFEPIFPSKEFCGDNAAMIAWAGIQRCKKNLFNKKNETVKSRWPLDVKAPFLKGPGLKF